MITCPECGQSADDGEKFCGRCGQGLGAPVAAPASLPPLDAGKELRGYRIVELLSQCYQENRYRAVRVGEGSSENVQLRERLRSGAIEELQAAGIDARATSR